MTVSAQNAYSGPFVPNGVTTDFPFTFEAASETELVVLLDGVAVDSGDYTVSLNAGNEGGTVVFTVAPTGDELLIASDPDFTQETSFENAGSFKARSHEQALDRLVVLANWLKNGIDRALRLPVGEEIDPLPGPAERANAMFGFDGEGDLLLYDPATFQGPQGPPGDISSSADMDELVALASPSFGDLRYVASAGGMFEFVAGDFSTQVTADTARGIYAESDDIAATEGAWVRKEFLATSRINARWFGAVGDGVTTGVDGPAILAALAVADALLDARGEGPGTVPSIHIPFGHYMMGTSTLNPLNTIKISGDGSGQASGYTTLLEWDDGCIGINSDARGLILEGLALKGGFTDTEGEYHAIYCTRRVLIRNCVIDGWSGDGIYLDGSTGNVNNFAIDAVRVIRCRNGIYADGADGNAGVVTLADLSSNRQWGIYDSSFLGNTYIACHAATNGESGAEVDPCFVSYNSNRYGVIAGQEAGASTNAPSGDATDNTWWYYHSAGGVTTGFPAWVSGTTYRAGGPYRTDGISANNVFYGCYNEGAAKAQLVDPTLVIGGELADGGVIGGAGSISVRSGHVASPDGAFASFGYSGTGSGVNGFFAQLGERSTTVKTALKFKDADNSTFWRLRVDGNDIRFDNNLGGTRLALIVTGKDTTEQFGKGVAQPYFAYFPNLTIGPAASTARKIGNDTAAPTTGEQAQGEFRFNRTPTGNTAHIAGWLCTVAGTPGTWVPVYTGPKRVLSDATTARTASLTDAHTHIRFSNAGAVTFTLPDDATVALPIDAEIDFSQEGAGVVTVAAGGSAVIRSRGGLLSTAGQYAAAGAKKVAANTWLLTGDLA